MEIKITFNILFSPKFASGKLERLVTLVTLATLSKACSGEDELVAVFSVAKHFPVKRSKMTLMINTIFNTLDFIIIRSFLSKTVGILPH